MEHLTLEERNLIMSKMNEQQRSFLTDILKRGRRTTFANSLTLATTDNKNPKSDNKQSFLFSSSNVDFNHDWELVKIVDAGAVVNDLTCECGRPLRYQYTVKNCITGQTLRFGSSHFALHMGIPDKVAQLVIRHLMKIDYELDEILIKYNNGEKYSDYIIRMWNNIIHLLPEDFKKQYELGLPFLEKQTKKIYSIIKQFHVEQLKNKQEQKDNNITTINNNTLVSAPTQSKITIEKMPNTFHYLVIENKTEKNKSTIHDSMYKRTNWSGIIEEIKKTSRYKNDLRESVLKLLNEQINSANAMVEILLMESKYREMFAHCTKRMCYLLVTARITEISVYESINIRREIFTDRSDTIYYLD